MQSGGIKILQIDIGKELLIKYIIYYYYSDTNLHILKKFDF